MSEKVIELSIEETNKLRAELGLAPLRLNDRSKAPEPDTTTTQHRSGQNDSKSEEELELSVAETNDLRARLGLKPLSTGGRQEIVHKPATNDRDAEEAAARIAHAKLQRDVQRGAKRSFGSQTLADDADKSALSWAARMRQEKAKGAKKVKPEKTSRDAAKQTYEDNDLEGLQVSHKMSELEAGSTTVLTLADASLLERNESNRATGLNSAEDTLENTDLRERKREKDGLKKKRMLEMGMGRAGGYAGFDDEEFEELGGTLGPSRKERGNLLLQGSNEPDSGRSFRLGVDNENSDQAISDFDAIQQGKAISLVPTTTDLAANDYMTVDEEQAEKAKKKMKKDGRFKKKKKKDRKEKKKRIQKVDESDDEETGISVGEKPNLLAQLEETAVPDAPGLRKRRKIDSDEADEHPMNGANDKEESKDKRARYDEIMAKGNERTKLAFQETKKPIEVMDDEPDDSFLNAALAKARRLNRLREMNQQQAKGADAVAQAVKISGDSQHPDTTSSSSALSFSVDDTREFTRAIQARAQQEAREKAKAPGTTGSSRINVELSSSAPRKGAVFEDVDMKEATEVEQDVDIHELAKEIKTDDVPVLDGIASEAAGVGRGLSSFVSMLKHTGEITGKHTKEELRGRAKDAKNYDNYEALDLSKVVKIGRNATNKDKEFAEREVKLEYRDKHGRLLTQKEAYRELCYQFHGHSGSKKKEDKKLRLIAQEQAEARLASRQAAAGTLGALKATQKATGKAFIVHKT
eukprot:scaffold25436_cov127-Cylindrotheca_fusiformis.AAC.1